MNNKQILSVNFKNLKIIIRSKVFLKVIVVWMTVVINKKLSNTKISLGFLDNEKKVNTERV
jgi:hypothetical protein